MKRMILAVVMVLAIIVATSTTASAAPKKGTNVYRIPTTQRVVALTFDDIWNDAYMTQILDALAAEGVHATFFPTGAGLAGTSALMQRAIAEGHDFGSHGYTHAKMTTLKSKQMWEQIRKARIAFQAQGVTPAPLYRTPYGAWNKTVLRVFRDTGYINVLWNLNANDPAYGMTVNKCVDRVVWGVRPGSIVLMHTQNPIAPQALPGIIQGLKARGYTFVTIREALGL